MEKLAKESPKEKLHYVDNKEFLKHMKAHISAVHKAKRDSEPLPQVSDFIGLCIMNIANKLANKPNFVNYPFRDEMIADGIENCFMYLNNFNPKKSNNPFAYFTQIIFFAFVRRIQKEKKHLYTKYKMIENTLLHEVPDGDGPQVTKYGSDESDAFMHEFVENFEKGREKKKKARKKKRKEKNSLEEIIDSDESEDTVEDDDGT